MLVTLKLEIAGGSTDTGASRLNSVFRVGWICLRQILLSGWSAKLVLDDVIPRLLSNIGV
jgi:hypothetical protein